MPKYGLCLDFDGTIVNSAEYGFNKLKQIIMDLGLPFDPEIQVKVRSAWGMAPRKMIELMWPGIDARIVLGQWQEDEGLIPLFPGCLEALVNLSMKHYLSMLTSRGRSSTEFQISSFKHLFRFIITYEDVQYHKPDPRSMDILLANYAKLGVAKDNIIFVGDTVEADCKLAQALGIEFFAVTGGLNNREQFLSAGVPADHIINSIADLPGILI